MWGHNRPASEEPAESSILWLRVHYCDCRTLRSAYWGVERWKKNPKRQRGTNTLGVAGGEARKKQGAMNYLSTPTDTVARSFCDPDSAFSAAVRLKLHEAVCPRNSPRKAQYSTTARAIPLKMRVVANLLH